MYDTLSNRWHVINNLKERIEMNVKFPIGQLSLPADVQLTDVEKWLDEINTYTDRLRRTVEGLTEEELTKTYREGSWNVRQLVHHIADSQLTMFHRLKLALTDDTPTVPNFEQDRWAELADSELPVESSLLMLAGMNERIVALGKSLTEKDLQKAFIHEKNGRITVATKLAKLSWHQEHHLAHITHALQS